MHAADVYNPVLAIVGFALMIFLVLLVTHAMGYVVDLVNPPVIPKPNPADSERYVALQRETPLRKELAAVMAEVEQGTAERARMNMTPAEREAAMDAEMEAMDAEALQTAEAQLAYYLEEFAKPDGTHWAEYVEIQAKWVATLKADAAKRAAAKANPAAQPPITQEQVATLADMYDHWDAEYRKTGERIYRELRDNTILTPADLARVVPAGATAPTTPLDDAPLPFPLPEETGEVTFKADEPQRLQDFDGQRHIVRPLEMALAALAPHERVLHHRLMTGLPGLGKTLIAKVIANELQLRAQALGLPPVRYVETYAANLNSVAALDEAARRLEASGGIWFIDEIHVLNKELATKLYLLMEEGRYPFEGSANPTPLPNVMLLGATTDYGALHAALKRRFGEPLHVRALDRDELRRLTDKLGAPITPEAADLLVSRCWQSGAPYELKTLFRESLVFSRGMGESVISVDAVQDVLDTYEIDANGLRPTDRAVIKALFQRPRYKGKEQVFVCYGGSESDVCAVARLDKAEFQETIRPRLLSRGYLEVRLGIGLALSPTAIADYQHLNATH